MNTHTYNLKNWYNLEKQNIRPLLNKILENKPKDAKVKIEITGNSLKSFISFYINDYSTSTLKLGNRKIELIRQKASTLLISEIKVAISFWKKNISLE